MYVLYVIQSTKGQKSEMSLDYFVWNRKSTDFICIIQTFEKCRHVSGIFWLAKIP